ncbi:hypothetical protein [Segeticoccus rhizosphaerae]|uniref:hypothetical protein n=1 Tax=Segeticoccus rhizosphaerae TaxID=1104777 RepID=UPI001939D8C7|nr:hypothetical protein [Segeticoccus rhizosphaerae]
MRLLAIDPGNEESAYVVIDTTNCKPLAYDKADNHELRRAIFAGNFQDCDGAYIEMIGHYGTGMPAGKTVFDTCVWIGRFTEAIRVATYAPPQPTTVLRPTIKAHICGTTKAKDPNVIQALVDRFAPGQPNHGKGTKAAPGWFHGFRADVWQAYALAVYAADLMDTSPAAAPLGSVVAS